MVSIIAEETVAVGEARVDRPEAALSWGPIFGGTVAAVALSVVLVAFGSGVGFSSISAWPGSGVSATTFGMTTAIWLIVTQWLSSAMGGYLAGRLRTRSIRVHTDEVYFRDTAHGFLSWALAAVIGTALLAVAAAGIAGESARGAASAAAGASGGADPTGYLVDTLFRATGTAAPALSDARTETLRLLSTDLGSGDVPDPDKAYLAQLVSARTGLSAPDAQARVNDVIAKAKAAAATARQKAEAARKAAVYGSFFTAFALAIGALIAAAAAALGGHHRDEF